LHEAAQIETRELQSWVRRGLPEIMVPSAFVVLERFPQTPNGKIDRKALPAPDLSRQSSSESFVDPKTPVELTIAQIWRDLLGVERVGVHDNFFELGGHSLSAVQLGLRLKQTYMVDVPLRSLFESPTVSAISVLVSSMQPKADRISEIMQQVRGMSADEASEALSGGPSRS
jgi:acyl carrier protein